MIRAKDLAAKLGVSAATVSLVLNNKPGICEETRKELRRKIVEMGYGYMFSSENGRQCNCDAPHKAQETAEGCETFAFVVYPICKECGDSWAFYAAVMEGASSFFREKGYQMVVIHPEPECVDSDCCNQGFSNLKCCLNETKVKGLIVQKPCLSEENIAELKSLELPFVMVDTYYFDEEISSVSVNNEQGVYKLIKHLCQQGHKRIGYVQSSADRATFCERQYYYRMLLQRLGMPFCEDWFIPIEQLGDCKAMLKNGGPTAFLTDNDCIACKLIMGLEDMGLKVPEDIAVAGFEDREAATLSSPAITTVKVPDRELGRTAAELLLNRLGDAERPTVKVELGVELVIRDSTVLNGDK